MEQYLSLDPIPLLIHLLSRQQKQGRAHRQPALAYLPDLIGLNLLYNHTGGFTKIGVPSPEGQQQQQQLAPSQSGEPPPSRGKGKKEPPSGV